MANIIHFDIHFDKVELSIANVRRALLALAARQRDNMETEQWIDIGSADELAQAPVQQAMLGGTRIAVTFWDGVFGAISGVCNHAGGPLGKGTLDNDYVVCPWHQ